MTQEKIKNKLRSFVIFTVTSVLIFLTGALLGIALVLFNRYVLTSDTSRHVVLILWSLVWGIRAYPLLLKGVDNPGKIDLTKYLHTFFYGIGTYLVLFFKDNVINANLFMFYALSGLLLVIVAPPYIVKYLKLFSFKRVP